MKELSEATKMLKTMAQQHAETTHRGENPGLADRRAKCHQLFRLTRSGVDSTYEWYKDRIERRVQGTCKWVLETDIYRTWSEQETGPLLISADPGCGKSVLAKYLIDNVLPRPNTTICYFFFKEPDQITVRQALCALLHQLFCSNGALIEHALPQYERDGEKLIDSTASLWIVLDKVVQDPRAGSIIIVLDALDEFGEDLSDLMKHIESHCCEAKKRNGELKYLLTGRPYEQILSSFRGSFNNHFQVNIPGENESEAISQEVNLVIRERVQGLAKQKNLSENLKNHLGKQLLSTEHRTYLWVYLVFDHLQKELWKKTERGIMLAIKTLPKSVHDAYSRILSKSKEDNIVRKALAIILVAQRPLTVAEMNVALNLEPGVQSLDEIDLESDEDFVGRLRAWCGLFISVYKGRIDFLHQTAREFLLGNVSTSTITTGDLRWCRYFTLQKAHAELATLCVHFLSLLKTDARNLMNKQPYTDPSERARVFTRFAVEDWCFHFCEASFSDEDAKVVQLALSLCDSSSELFDTWFQMYCELAHENPGFTTVLEVASFLGLRATVKSLLREGVDVEARDTVHNRTPLLWAIRRGHSEIAQMLLNAGADANTERISGETALRAAIHLGDQDLVEMLLCKGADFKKHEKEHVSILEAAVSSKAAFPIVKLLLDQGVNPDARHEHFGSVLALAAHRHNADIVGLLLKKGAIVDQPSGDYGTALGAAASSNPWSSDQDTIHLLLDNGADVNAKGKWYGPPLCAAAHAGNKATFETLLQRGADVSIPGGKFGTALGAAAHGGSEEIINLIIALGADIDQSIDGYGNALNVALYSNEQSAVQLLIEAGIDIHKEGGDCNNALGYAAYSENISMVEQLLVKGVSMHVGGYFFANILAVAAYIGDKEIVELLLGRRADLHQKGGLYCNAVGAAACGDRGEMVMFLLDRGADLYVRNKDGSTLLNLAAGLRCNNTVKILLENGIDVNTANTGGWTPIFSASEKGHLSIVKTLLSNGATFTTEKYGWSPLMVAADRGHLLVVCYLLDHEATMGITCDGQTPLHRASMKGHANVAKVLLKYGADVSCQDRAGQIALQCATSASHADVVALLLEAGADPTTVTSYGHDALSFAVSTSHVDCAKILMRAYKSTGGLHRVLGTVANLIAFYGHTALLQDLQETYPEYLYTVEPQGRTPLLLAAASGCFETYMWVISHGFDASAIDAKGDSLLCFAASGGSLSILNHVIDNRTDSDPQGGPWTPLHWACRVGKADIVERLISLGRQSEIVTIPDNDETWSPLAIAYFHGHKDLLDQLSERSQNVLRVPGNGQATISNVHGGTNCDGCYKVSCAVVNPIEVWFI